MTLIGRQELLLDLKAGFFTAAEKITDLSLLEVVLDLRSFPVFGSRLNWNLPDSSTLRSAPYIPQMVQSAQPVKVQISLRPEENFTSSSVLISRVKAISGYC